MNVETCRRLTRRLHARAPWPLDRASVDFDINKGYRITLLGWAPVTLGHTSRDAIASIDRMAGWLGGLTS